MSYVALFSISSPFPIPIYIFFPLSFFLFFFCTHTWLKPISETFRETGGLDEAALWLTQKAVPLASRSGPPGDQGRKSDLFFEDSSISFGTVQVQLGEPSKKKLHS